jgi:serine/threonine protein kinase
MAGSLSVWKVLKELGSGGQGRVSLVVDRDKDPIKRIVEPLKGLVPGANREDELEELRRRFGDALLDFVRGRYGLGALKQLTNPTEEATARLKIEAHIYETVADAHLLRIIDKKIDENWIVTEFQPNGTLSDRLESFKGHALTALRAIRPVVNVLAKMDASAFVHRDFKPGNIFIGNDGEFVLGDAGLAFYQDLSGSSVTQTYENVGTREYMPAWAYGQKTEIRPTFDSFSVGKVIWAMIAGRPACPLWYVFKDEFNLVKLFPEKTEMLWINELLGKCVVEEEEKDMKLLDAQKFLSEIDSTIDAIEANATPAAYLRRVKRRCRVCGEGFYHPNPNITLGNDGAGNPINPDQCPACGILISLRSGRR